LFIHNAQRHSDHTARSTIGQKWVSI